MPVTTLRHSLAFVLLLLVASSTARGQEPRPAELDQKTFVRGDTVTLNWAWRFRPGDDPRWADPTLDDSGWGTAEPLPLRGGPEEASWPGVGWYRRHLRFDPALFGRPLLFRVAAPGSARLYLDGKLLLRSDGATAQIGDEADRGAFAVVPLPSRPEHVLAVRYEISRERLEGSGSGGGFLVSIEAPDAAGLSRGEERRVTLAAIVLAVAGFLALFHLALFWSYPKARENLYYAASMAAFVGIIFSDGVLVPISSAAYWRVANRANTPLILATIFFILLTYLAVRVGRLPRSWIGFAVVGIGLAVWSWFDGSEIARRWTWYLYFGAMLVETVRVESRLPKARREGMQVLLVGLAVTGAVIVLQVLITAGAVPAPAGFSEVYVFGVLAFVAAMSLFLVGTFASTSKHLERRLVEVSTLSEQILEQERAAHEQELASRLLEAEDARKSDEIAAARELQLSMLPGGLPEAPGLEAVAVMTTATEVGGDYYDWKTGEDGSLLVALGDAAGHGLAAGTLVTAVKAIFTVLNTEPGLAATLAEYDRALRGMNVHSLHMCLTLARITPVAATVCSAAMPPALLYRAETSEVEELGAGGLPLGARLRSGWKERRTALAPGDTLLFATDGLAELLAPDGTELGFDGAARIFQDAAGAPVHEVLERVMEQANAWRGERMPTDDLTLVAVRVLPAGA